MAETVNTSALLLSDGNGGYSKAFMESMTDIVKLQNGSSLTEKLAEIDGKLPITLTSGTLPETLNSGQLLVNGNDFYIGNGSNRLSKIAREDQIPSAYTHPSTIQCNAAAASHTHAAGDVTSGTFAAARIPSLAASKITAGTLAGKVLANASAQATVTTAQLRDIYAGTSDIGAGASLASGRIYLVYE